MRFKWIFNYLKPEKKKKREIVMCNLLFHFLFNYTSKGQ